ncbi:hypothetical protein PC9H_011703 [Pleurotus ostreatus]|uniref:Uncharacterized protein n=1 Tax=Pleurotus ostreatus TaxID=5322 RepID=A0A8H7DNE5_PLEOS|nr:uncharacterized protein PC9H_011703 [Pleurotus ostreatus]KAF7421183.1 hypothetical protein PC9H_011703 [Pleurotus ostreatus]
MREPRQEFRLFLATPNESNVRGRPDRGSPWIGVPSRLEASSNMFVKKEHNEPFSVSIMHKDEEYDWIENVVKVFLRADRGMTSVGYYHSYFDLHGETSEDVVVISQDGTRRVWEAKKGQVNAFDFRMIQVHLTPKPVQNDIVIYKKGIIEYLAVMMHPSTSPHEHQLASDSIDILLPLFRSHTAQLALL